MGVLRALELAFAAAQARVLYGADHAAATRAESAAVQAFAAEREAVWPVCVVVGPEGLIVDASPGATCEVARELAGVLRRADVAALNLSRNPTAPEAARLIEALHALAEKGRAARDALVSDGMPFLRATFVDGASMRFRGEAGTASAASATWTDLCRSLAGRGRGRAAAALDAATSGLSDADSSAARRVLSDKPTAGPAARSDALQRVALLSGMSPGLRKALVSVGLENGSPWATEHADLLHVNDLSEALTLLDTDGESLPDTTLMLLRKLSGQRGMSDAVRTELERMASKWAAPTHAGRPATSINELMCGRDQIGFSPEDYAARLRDVASSESSAAAHCIGVTDLSDDFTRDRSFAISLWLLEDREPSLSSNEGSLNCLASGMKHMARIGCLDLIERSGRAAKARAEDPDAAVRAACERVRRSMEDDETIGRLLTSTSEADLARIISLSPRAAVQFILRRIESGQISPQHPHAAVTAMTAPVTDLRDALASAMDGNAGTEARRRAVMALLDHVSADQLCFALEPVLDRKDEDVRAEAFQLLDRRLAHWPPRLQQAAMADESDRVHTIACRRIVRDPESYGVEPLAAMIEQCAGGPRAERAASAAIEALASRGGAGAVRLARSLLSLGHGLSRQRIVLCERIAAALEPHRTQPEVQMALKSWRRSIGFAVKSILPAREGRKEAA